LTGQAYDEMQEQNDRLLQQLSSKDDANFKLMSDRINANQKQALLSAQIEELEKQVRKFKIHNLHFDVKLNFFSIKYKNIKWTLLYS
jgi:hypothetical protein